MEPLTTDETLQLFKCLDIPIIENGVNYWFIRTDGGSNFEKFYFNSYVAIGWDHFTDLAILNNIEHDELKTQVEEAYPIEKKPGSIASQILRFVNEIQIGDYVMIPGENCDLLAFGKIISDAYIYEPTEEEQFDAQFDGTTFEYFKRRNVEWITDRPFRRSEIDPLLVPIIYSYGTIIFANRYADFINRTLYDMYYRNGKLHSIFNISRREDISAYELNNFINNIFHVMDDYSKLTGEQLNKEDLYIKASINSPGPVEIITAATSIFIVLSAISLFLNGAKVKFDFNIFSIVEGSVDIDTPGLLDKLKSLQKSDENHPELSTESEKQLKQSQKNLKIKKKSSKKNK